MGEQAITRHDTDDKTSVEQEIIAAIRNNENTLLSQVCAVEEIFKKRAPRLASDIDHRKCAESCPSPEAHYRHLWGATENELANRTHQRDIALRIVDSIRDMCDAREISPVRFANDSQDAYQHGFNKGSYSVILGVRRIIGPHTAEVPPTENDNEQRS